MRRRSFLILLGLMLQAVCLLPASLRAQPRIFVDAAGRSIELPASVDRVLAAGPPASVLLYALAPEKMVGWVREFTEEEQGFIAEPYRGLPAHGRLTGRGNTANLEMVLAMKPDIILDVGTVDATYASLADRVQEQTGIPYVLIDGSFVRTPETLREVGDLLGVQIEPRTWRSIPRRRWRGWIRSSRRFRRLSGRASTMAAGRRDWRPA